ncbi:hypothetical protein MUP95_06120, partial [bacterium]|nr:hypothetical protein [bacterium]
KNVKIKKEYRSKYSNAFYLPVWVMIESDNIKRPFSYVLDIKSKIDLSKFVLSKEIIERLKSSLSEETQERQSIVVSLDSESKFTSKTETMEINSKDEINVDYLTRRYFEIIENPFLSRKNAINHIKTLIASIGKDKVSLHFSYIAAFMFNALFLEKSRQEESLFLDYLKANKLVLAVSDDSEMGYKIPQEDTITVSRIPNPYKYYLFEDVDILTMNPLEQKVGDFLDKQGKILWWFRNKVSKNWYSIQGWREYKIRPDFVAAKKKDKNELELVYIIESKGEHLSGNPDTIYKKSVLDVMMEQKNLGKIEVYQQLKLPLYSKINDHVEFYLIEEGKEEESIKKLYK